MEEGTLTYKFVNKQSTFAGKPNRAYVVYLLRGQLTASIGEPGQEAESTRLAERDFIAANVGQTMTLKPARGSLALACIIDTHRVARLTNGRPLWLMLTPRRHATESYQNLQRAFDGVILALADTSDLAKLHRDAAEARLVAALIDGFWGSALEDSSGETKDRSVDYRAYVDAHYDEPLQLADVARHFNLSSDYLAKSFHKQVGSTFLAYLTGVRLEAAEDLLVANDRTVARVALEAGFPNVASFNRAFSRKHGQTPSAWRRDNRRLVASKGPSISHEALRGLSESSAVVQADDSFVVKVDARDRVDDPSLSAGTAWREDIGLGSVAQFSDARVIEQVTWLHQRLNFVHGRIWCDFEKYFEEPKVFELERCVDYIASEGISPHWAINCSRIKHPESFAVRLERLLRHFSNRYSINTVRGWWFDLILGQDVEADFGSYLALFSQVQSMLQRLGIRRGLFGPGILPNEGCENLREFLRATRMRGIVPNSISIACRPFTLGKAGETGVLNRSADRYYLRQQVLAARDVLAEEGFDPATLVVGSWVDSLESGNIMNDSCYEGANICRGLLTTGGLASVVCYDQALDLFSDVGEGYSMLAGKPGILSVDRIPKPSFYAFSFLGHVGQQVIYADERTIMSENAMGNFQMVCHNCEKLNAKYLATPEASLTWEELPTYFETPSARKQRVRIAGVREGSYLIKIRTVNDQRGSLMDEVAGMNLGCMDDPSRSEIEYLRQVVVPRLQLKTARSHDGVLEFSHTMQSNEIAYLHIIFEY